MQKADKIPAVTSLHGNRSHTHEPMIPMRNSGSLRVMKKTKHEMEGGQQRCYSRKDSQQGPPGGGGIVLKVSWRG